MFGIIEIIIYMAILYFLAASPLMGSKWSVCGINHCGKRRGHTDAHSWEKASSSESTDVTEHPPIPLQGEIGALRRIQRDVDPELGTLLLDAYLKNRTKHKYAQKRIAELKIERMKAEMGVY